MSRINHFIFLLQLSASFQFGYGQQYFFKNYSVESGLPFVQVACLYQDLDGYLWSGGYGGLSRFDGHRFVNFNKKNGLVDVNVNVISGDETGGIFIGTNKGLSVFQNHTFSNYGKNEGLLNSHVTAISKGYHHAMYVGTKRGLFLLSKNKIKAVKKLADYKINCLFKSDTTALFIGTDQGLVVYGHSAFKLLNTANGLPSNKINCITSFKGKIVIGTDKGMSFYDFTKNKFTNYFEEQGLIDNSITALVNQNDKYLWIGSQTGLLRFDNSLFSYYNVDLTNNSNQINAILNDQEDNIWLGTYSGLYRYRDNSFSTFDKITGPGNSFVHQIFRDKKNDLWICSQDKGIFKYTQNYFKNYTVRDGLWNSLSYAGMEDNEGHLLFGSGEGLVKYTNERFSTIDLPKKFKGPVLVMFQDSKKTIWLGGKNGISSLKWQGNIPITKFYPLKSKVDLDVFGFSEDKEGNLFIGSYHGGLFVMKGDSVINLTQRFNLNEDDFFTLRYLDGKLFGATLNGLAIIDLKNFSVDRINLEDGLNSDLVYSIEFAENRQSLWIGTNQGINKLNLKKYMNDDAVELTSIGKQEGFAGVECNGNGIWEDKDGTLWFGTVSGLVKYQPFNFIKNNKESSLVIQKIQLMNEDTMLEKNMVLPSYYNTITFHYTGICLTNPDKVLYQKMLVGLEKDWSEPSSEDYSKYANLSPGKYIFKVRSCNNEGIWNTSEIAFPFEINRPFYSSWWFISILLLLVSTIVYGIFLFRIYNIKKIQRLDFERKVEMSKIELKAMRSQMNPHFIFNSLNSIQHYIIHNKSDEATKYLSKFARLIRMILNNSDKPTVTVGEDIDTLRLYMELEQMRFEDKFEYDIVVDKSVDPDYDIMPPLLMQPYVENAILHGLNPKPEKGKLIIHIYSENNFLICTITDNGIGREKSSEIKRTMPTKNHKSIGMKITEERLKILNEINASKLSVTITDLKNEQQVSEGTKVELFIPLNG